MRGSRTTPSHLATGAAVRPYRVTVATMTRNVAGRIFSAPRTLSAIRPVANVVAVAAATMPRGAIQPTKSFSGRSRSPRSVPTHATSGRATITRTAATPSAGSSTSPTDSGVTVAEIETNSTPMTSWTSVSKNGRRSGTPEPGQVAHRDAHDDRGGEPAVVAQRVADRHDADDRPELGERAEHPGGAQRPQQHPQHGGAEQAAEQADAHAAEEVTELLHEPLVTARGDGVEDDRPEGGADRVDQRSLPGEHPLAGDRRAG